MESEDTKGTGRRSRAEFLNRLGYYLLGTLIGCLLLWMFTSTRQTLVAREKAAQEAAKAAAAAREVPGTSRPATGP